MRQAQPRSRWVLAFNRSKNPRSAELFATRAGQERSSDLFARLIRSAGRGSYQFGNRAHVPFTGYISQSLKRFVRSRTGVLSHSTPSAPHLAPELPPREESYWKNLKMPKRV
jgi:hypothetical protein